MDNSILGKIESTLERKIYRESFYEFYKVAFCQLHPGQEYDENWHAKYICDILQSETERVLAKKPREKDIIINVPPRSSKSIIASVIWPVWMWTIDASLKFLSCSYADTLATSLSRLSKDLIDSDFYQRLWGRTVRLRPDLQGASHYGTTATGFRYAFGMDGTVTGFGGDFLLCLRGDQLITTNIGRIPIERIINEILDVKVLSFNHDKNTQEYKTIKRYDKNPGRKLMRIKTKSGKEIYCTEDHPMWTENREYVVANKLIVGDIVKNEKEG